MAEIRTSQSDGLYYECPSCGEDIELGQKYCSECGEPIEWIEDLECDDE